MRCFPAFLLLAACGNSLAPPGMCEVATGPASATVEPVALGGAGGYDDLTYSRALGRVVAAPEGTGRVFLVDPESMDVTSIGVPGGTASADASATTLYVVDRSAARIVAFDVASAAMTAMHGL